VIVLMLLGPAIGNEDSWPEPVIELIHLLAQSSQIEW
jgi:hypothetical protein